MGKNNVLGKLRMVHLERKYVVDIDKNIDITKITPSTRVALCNDSYVLHLILQRKVDPLVNVMKVEKDPDSTYDMIGGLDQQIKEIKEPVCTESGMFALWERRVDVTQEDFEMVVAKVHLEWKYVVDIDKNIDITNITPSTRVALRNDSYVLHLILQSKVDPLVNLMKVEKVPDSTYDMIGGLDQQIKEIKEGWVTYMLAIEN
ncbi:26S proteasome regulatory subunit 8 homolog A-like [Quercus lobata]|uniref:26S proteasome regulatory subunit 8 homolog A-like n=1 Tax=Quercus lobata TaxID=97700 RepID=UPI00124888B5|nr:26S proteasome regulatory subunit 8 homolog A-like [Quercus lobata]